MGEEKEEGEEKKGMKERGKEKSFLPFTVLRSCVVRLFCPKN